MLKLLRLAAERLLISQSVFSRPSWLLEPRPLVRLFTSIQLPGGFLLVTEQLVLHTEPHIRYCCFKKNHLHLPVWKISTPYVGDWLVVVMLRIKYGLKDGAVLAVFLILITDVLVDGIHHHVGRLFVVLHQLPQLIQPGVHLLQLPACTVMPRAVLPVMSQEMLPIHLSMLICIQREKFCLTFFRQVQTKLLILTILMTSLLLKF